MVVCMHVRNGDKGQVHQGLVATPVGEPAAPTLNTTTTTTLATTTTITKCPVELPQSALPAV